MSFSCDLTTEHDPTNSCQIPVTIRNVHLPAPSTPLQFPLIFSLAPEGKEENDFAF